MLQQAFHAISIFFTFTWNHLFWINIFLAIIIVFFERRDPRTVWTWLLALYFIPVLGFVLYLVVGQDMHKNKMFKTKEIEDAVNFAVHRQEQNVRDRKIFSEEDRLARYSDLVMYNLSAANAVYTDDNEVKIYTDGVTYFQALREEIEKAEEFIHIQSYIIKNDEVWKPLEKLLAKKAAEGVEVRILYDSMGCRSMRNSDWKRIREAGIQVGEFFPALYGRLQLRMNYRNHRKIVVIDGRKAFIGGFNIGREYVGLDRKFGYWRDTHLKISGSAVVTLHIRFILDWNYATGENLFLQEHLFTETLHPGKGSDGIQVVSSGPDSVTQEIRDNYLKLISKARHHIYIQTPYFIPDEAVFTAIRMAALSGIEVKIMIPCKPDHPFVYWATYSYIGELLDAGVECYTYDNGFLHAKGIMTDSLVSSYGTANMDIRSFKLNFEVNATIYSPETTGRLEAEFEKDLEHCTRITPNIYENRGLVIRFKEQFSRMFSLIL